MAKHGKKYIAASKKIEAGKRYLLTDACKLVVGTKVAKFDESVDVAIRLGVDPRHADQMVRGSALLPNGTGKTVRVAVFAKGAKLKEAEDAGADVFGNDELATKIEGGFFDFDVVVATPDMMGVVGKLGRVLGPRGLMPNPKVGTVTMDVARQVKELKSGRVEFKVDKFGNLHVPVGRASFAPELIEGNVRFLWSAVMKAKPATVKGQYMRNTCLSTTMGPGIQVDLSEQK